jgi:hypothetical protein
MKGESYNSHAAKKAKHKGKYNNYHSPDFRLKQVEEKIILPQIN